MDGPVKRPTISAGLHPSAVYYRVDLYKSHLSIESKSNEANADRYLRTINPRVNTASEKKLENRLTASQQAKVNNRDNAGDVFLQQMCLTNARLV